MARDRATEAHNMAQSMVLNQNRAFHCDCISHGVEVPGLTPDDDGFYPVSYHMAGKRSAWVLQNKLRRKFPLLDTKVVPVVDKPWTAEIRVKRKERSNPVVG